MNILFLAHRFPSPPDKGDRIRSYNIIKFLAKSHNVSLMSVTHEPVHPHGYGILRSYCSSVDVFKIDPRLSKLRACFSLLTKDPLTLPVFYSREFHRALKKKLAEKSFDIIYIYSSAMAQYVLDVAGIPKLMDFIDVDSQKWLDYTERASYPMKLIYRREGLRLRAFEKKAAAICDQNIFVSDKEREVFRSFAGGFSTMVLSNGAEAEFKANGSHRDDKLVFIGAMDYLPNIDAMLYFTGEILPLVRRAKPGVKLCIVGRNPARRIKALGRLENVMVTGHVEDVRPYLSDAAASVIPLRIARGVQNKILEAMACGVPVIATSCALGGIEAKPGREVLVADDPVDFAEKTAAVLKDKNLRDRLAENALAVVRGNYSWEEKLKPLEKAMEVCSEKEAFRKIPLVSFIIPARNEEKMIGHCLDAVQELDYDADALECIVVDNGSVDRTAEIARAKGARVFSLPGATISELRNFGAKKAKGDFLAFIDADCVVAGDWARRALRHFGDPAAGCVGSYPAIPAEPSWVQKAWKLQNQRGGPVEEVDWLPSANILVRKNAFVDIGGFNEALMTCEDVDLCYRLRKRDYKIISDNRIRSVHLGEDATASAFFRKERWRGQGNLRGVLSHGLTLREIPSLALPIVYLCLIAALPLTLFHGFSKSSFFPFFVNFGLMLMPPVLLSLRASWREGRFTSFVQLAFLYFLYALARTAAIFPMGQASTKRDITTLTS